MAEGILNDLNPSLIVYSAGTKPEKEVNPYAIEAMKEIGIDISRKIPKSINDFLDTDFDYVVTVCDNAKETCPLFYGKVAKRRHIGFEDPALAAGTHDEILSVYRKIRDQIRVEFTKFNNSLNFFE